MTRPVIAIYNPVCGDSSAKDFFDKEVLPLLKSNGTEPAKVVGTEEAGHAGKIILEFLESLMEEITVVLGSGDGTLHEIINFISKAEFKATSEGPQLLPRIHFVLVPCGTANALYSSLFPPKGEVDTAHRLQSVQLFIAGEARAVPLTLAITTLSSPPVERRRPEASISAVVASTSLHAVILHESETLRKEIPGMERFKVAAENNSTKWYSSYVKLLPAPELGVVQQYDPSTKTFEDHSDSEIHNPYVDIYGPFAYFLSTVNVDRLEPAFRITPLVSDIPPTDATLDVVIVRPLQDPSISWETPEAREAFKPKLWEILGAAYKNGTHVDLRYNEKGEIVTEGDGPAVVEYFRCGGWEWIPDDIDDAAHLLCSDGAISTIKKGGRAVCTAATPQENRGFVVFA